MYEFVTHLSIFRIGYHFDNLEELSIEKINIEMNLMDAYWEYKFDDQEKEIVSQLLKEISRKYVLGGMKTGFHNMCVLISQQLNVSDMASIIGMLKYGTIIEY